MPDGGHNALGGTRTYRWLPDQSDHDALVNKLRCGPPPPRPAVDVAVSHWPGTLLGVVAIIAVGVLCMAAAALLDGVKL